MPDLVVVVDDDEDIASLVSFSLRAAGYEVAVAVDGDDAIRLCIERKAAALVADMMMPSPDGLEICRWLRLDERTTEMPILMLTAAPLVNPFERSGSGVTCWLDKPFDPETLVARINDLVNSDSGE